MFTENISIDITVKFNISCVKVISFAWEKEEEKDVISGNVKLVLEIVIWTEETVSDVKICICLQIFLSLQLELFTC